MVILVRYGEIGLKSNKVRKRFEDILIKNIVNSLYEKKIESIVSAKRGRIYVYTTKEKESIEVLKKIFGIVSFSIAIEIPSNLNDICKLSVELAKKLIKKNQSFAVRVTRSGEHKYTSQEVAREIGSKILDNINCSVNLTKPDVTIFVEIRDNRAYIYSEKILCIGGFPLESQGKVLSIVKDKYSIIATWLIMKRGCKVIPIVYNDSSVEILKILEEWGLKSEPMKLELNESIVEICKQITRIAVEKKGEALVISEKNPKNCNFKIDISLDIPVFRPLIGMNEKEIEQLFLKIGFH